MVDIISGLNSLAANFTLQEALGLLKPLLLFILGIAVYSLFIFKFYRYVARREVFKFNLEQFEKSRFRGFRKFFHLILYVIKYLIFFPILIFFWFLVLSVILSFLSKSDNMESVLLITFALVAVIRIMAYYNEDLSKDLAKMLPFALLGVFLVDISFFSASTSISTLLTLPGLWKIGVYYLIFIAVLELVLRVLFLLFGKKVKKKVDSDEKAD